MSDQGDTDRTFTQADIDRIVQDRLAREQKKYDGNAAELAEQHKKRESELEAQLHETNARFTEVSSRVRDAQIGEAIARVSVERGIRDIDAASRLIDPNLVEVTESGVKVDVAIDALLESKPYLRQPRGSVDQGARGGKQRINREGLKHMTVDETNAALESGQLDHLLGRGG
jgi:hypothetical protein